METNTVPDIVVGRLPHYLHILQSLQKEGVKSTSSKELSLRLGFSAAQIRKDLSHFGEFGKQGTGYSIPFLLKHLQKILNLEEIWEIVLIGVGDLGHAIARYQGFTNRGFHISAVFDSDPGKFGSQVGSFTIQDIADAPAYIKQHDIQIAMLTVPANQAQAVADNLVSAGIQAILTYAPAILQLPDGIQVRYIDPLIELQHMTYYLTGKPAWK